LTAFPQERARVGSGVVRLADRGLAPARDPQPRQGALTVVSVRRRQPVDQTLEERIHAVPDEVTHQDRGPDALDELDPTGQRARRP
jgi:hypothetical protein